MLLIISHRRCFFIYQDGSYVSWGSLKVKVQMYAHISPFLWREITHIAFACSMQRNWKNTHMHGCTHKLWRLLSVWEGRQTGHKEECKTTFTILEDNEKHAPKWRWLMKELFPVQYELKAWTNGRQENNSEEQEKGGRWEEAPILLL